MNLLSINVCIAFKRNRCLYLLKKSHCKFYWLNALLQSIINSNIVCSCSCGERIKKECSTCDSYFSSLTWIRFLLYNLRIYCLPERFQENTKKVQHLHIRVVAGAWIWFGQLSFWKNSPELLRKQNSSTKPTKAKQHPAPWMTKAPPKFRNLSMTGSPLSSFLSILFEQ